MPEYKCIKKSYSNGRLYEEGEIVIADKAPNSHFQLTGSKANEAPAAKTLEQMNAKELLAYAKKQGINVPKEFTTIKDILAYIQKSQQAPATPESKPLEQMTDEELWHYAKEVGTEIPAETNSREQAIAFIRAKLAENNGQ